MNTSCLYNASYRLVMLLAILPSPLTQMNIYQAQSKTGAPTTQLSPSGVPHKGICPTSSLT